MFRETTNLARSAAPAAPPVVVTTWDTIGLYIDPTMKIITIVYTVLMIIKLLRDWRRKGGKN